MSLSSTVRCGVIGYGYWGPNMVRNVAEAGGASLAMVSDLNPERLKIVAKRFPSVKTTTSAQELIASPDVDAVIIATPVSTHYDLAMAAIEQGKHVLIEKPIAETMDQAQRLIEAAARRGVTLMVDHTFIYTGAVMKMADLISSGELGDLYYYDSTRVNLGLFQHDVSVIYDLAVHDLAILDHVIKEKPVEVSAVGASHVPNAPYNMGYVTLFYQSGLIAHVNVNWLAPVKIRRTLVGGSRKMVVYDDIEPSEKIKIYDKGVDTKQDLDNIYRLLISYRSGDMWAPVLDQREALGRGIAHFVDCIVNSKEPTTGGEMAARVLQYMTMATESMNDRGRPRPLAKL